MIGARKNRNLVASRYCPRHASSSQHRFRSSIGERHALHPGEFANQFRDFSGDRLNRTDFKSQIELLLHRFHNERRPVPKNAGAETHNKIYVLVAVHVPDF